MTINPEKYKDEYRIPSARATWWNYGRDAAYFVTICTKQKINYFGKINDGKMKLSEIGTIVETEWRKTADLRPDMNLTLGEFVVMPNHFHAIIIIGENQYNNSHYIDTNAVPQNPIITKNRFAAQSKNLPAIIRGFKIGVTAKSRKIRADFKWQSRYHDRIIRDYEEYQRIENYIFQNPLLWENDKLYSL